MAGRRSASERSSAADSAVIGRSSWRAKASAGGEGAEASLAAIRDAGLTPADIDGLITFTLDTSDELLLMRALGPGLQRLRSTRGTVALGLVFGLNIPACAAPLILALLALAAAGGASAAQLGAGFVSLGLFGLALSLPLVLAVLFAPFRRLIDRLAALSRKIPRWTGALFIVLGLWSIWFGLFVSISP